MSAIDDASGHPTAGRLTEIAADARPPDVALDPADMGAAWPTRHSFARSFLRAAARERWMVTKELVDLDADGRGEVVLVVDTPGHRFRFVAFSTAIAESDRSDRVVADRWDVTAALVEDTISPDRMDELRREVPRQEAGRADAATLVLTRANRSQRFFDYVVSRLAAGHQPEVDVMGDDAYILRSTAFYGNGKWGTADFARFGSDHPFRVPYRAQMLCAWLLRELSYELAEHVARNRNPDAAELAGGWRRYLGLGNATGLGMVPYIVNHPETLDRWVRLRELALANALDGDEPADDGLVSRLERARDHLRERDTLATAPYPSGPLLADALEPIIATARAGLDRAGPEMTRLVRQVHDAATAAGPEVRQIVDSVLVEGRPEIDDEIEQLLLEADSGSTAPGQRCGELLANVAAWYGWVDRYDFDDPDRTHHFWYYSIDNEEPRRGVSGSDAGADVAMPIDVARAVTQLAADLDQVPASTTVAEFLVARPWHRGIVSRVQRLDGTTYGEVLANLLDADFLPLDLQRFQLAVYGMENFSPQSTDWLRVTLFSGAPRVDDVAAGVDDGWLFTPKPQESR